MDTTFGRTETGSQDAGSREFAVVGTTFVLLALVGLGTLVAPSSRDRTLIAVGLVFALAVGVYVRLTLVELTVVLVPVMFFPPIGQLVHVSVADFLLPILLVRLLVRRGRVDGRALRAPRLPAVPAGPIYAALAVLTLVLSTSYGGLVDTGFRYSLAVVDSGKLVVGFLYLAVFYVEFVDAGPRAVIRATQVWTWTASIMGAGSVLGVVPSDGYRSLGYFQDPNLYAGYLILSLTLTLWLMTYRASRLWLCQVAIISAGILTTGSRGAILSMSLVLLASLLLRIPSKAKLWIAAVGVLGGVVLALAESGQLSDSGLLGLGRLTASSHRIGSDPRLNLWHEAASLFANHPIMGVGIGQFPRYSVDLTNFKGNGVGQVAHNSFLSVAVELGLIGCLVYYTAFLWLIRRAFLVSRRLRRNNDGLVLGMVAIAGQMLTLNLQNLRYVWVFFALVLWASRDTASTELPVDGGHPARIRQT